MAHALDSARAGLSPLDLMQTLRHVRGPAQLRRSRPKRKTPRRISKPCSSTRCFSSMFTGIDGDGPFGGSGATGVWRSMLTDNMRASFAKAGGIGIADQVYQKLLAQQEVKA